jgi:hypothetical protein
MKTTLALLALAIALLGCRSTRPALLVEMNGRRLEFDSFVNGKVPKGNEVLNVDPTRLQVKGDGPIEVNGISLLARGDDLTVGGRKLTVDRDFQVKVLSSGEIQIIVPSKSGPASSPAPSTPVPSAPAP